MASLKQKADYELLLLHDRDENGSNGIKNHPYWEWSLVELADGIIDVLPFLPSGGFARVVHMEDWYLQNNWHRPWVGNIPNMFAILVQVVVVVLVIILLVVLVMEINFQPQQWIIVVMIVVSEPFD